MKNIPEKLGFSTSDIRVAAGEIPAPELPETPEPTIQEASFDAAQVHDLAKEDMDFLAALVMPTIFQYCYPSVFKAVWNWLLEYVHKTRDFSQLALGLPRGFGKSTVMKLFILYCILFTNKKFILIIAATAQLAENILSDVVDMLEEENVKRVFGDWKLGVEKDTQAVKKFGFRGRNIILAGLGAGTSLRGLNMKNERPDVMLFDDVQTRECADSVVESTKLETWMVGTAMKAKSPLGCMFLFVGNMYPTKNSVLRKLKSNPKWIKFIAGGILADGTSLWEELQPVTQLLSEFESDMAMGHPEIFYSEVLNDENASANNLLDFSKLKAYPYEDDEIAVGKAIIIDPSNDKSNSDAVSLGYMEVIDTKPVMREVVEGRFSPGDTIKEAIRLCLKHNCRLVAIEANAYQYSLLYWCTFITAQLGIIGIEFVPVYSGSLSKNTRILNMLKSYAAAEFYIHPDARTACHLQIMQFNPLKRDNTDGLLDLLTYMSQVVQEYGEFLLSSNIIEQQEFSAIPVLEHNSSF